MPTKSSHAPDFSLPDINNRTVTLSAFRGQCHVVLVFNRGLACPFCRQHMALLRRDFPSIVARRAIVVVVAPERAEALRAYWVREEMPMIGLADPDHAVASLYGQQVNLFQAGRLPAMVIIDMAGRIRFSHYGSSMADIPTLPALLEQLDSIAADS
jgi:peroxiredoxin